MKMTFKISKDGKVTVDVDGAQGTICKDVTRPFIDALGTEVSTVEKPELYDQVDDIETSLYRGENE